MPIINTQDLTGAALDWAVAACDQELTVGISSGKVVFIDEASGQPREWTPSTDPAQGHQLLDRYRISLQHLGDRIGWGARWPVWVPDGDGETIPAATGPTMLIAGLRCHVAARLGPTVDVPQELVP